MWLKDLSRLRIALKNTNPGAVFGIGAKSVAFPRGKQASVNIISCRVNRCFAPNKYFPAQLSRRCAAQNQSQSNYVDRNILLFRVRSWLCVKFPPRRRVRTNKARICTHAQRRNAPLRDDFQSPKNAFTQHTYIHHLCAAINPAWINYAAAISQAWKSERPNWKIGRI